MLKILVTPRCLILILLLAVLPVASPAQLVIGQYEDEAPLRTWNTFGSATAAAIGRGETVLAQADDTSAAVTNPALLAGLPRFTLCLSGSYSSNTLFRYSIVNTGVLASEKNLSSNIYSVDFGGLSVRIKGWTFALTAVLSEVYNRPQAYVKSVYEGAPYSAILFDQSGFLRTINVAVARRLGRRFQAGIGLNFAHGELQRRVEDEYFENSILISQRIDQSFSGFYLNGGLLARVTDRWDLALVFRTSHDRKSESRSEFRYQVSPAGTQIVIGGASDDRYHQPWAAGAGARCQLTPRFQVLGELTYFAWSGYEVEYFGEKKKRDFDPAFKAAGGGEYTAPLRLFGSDVSIPLRLGIGYDRQPMRNPRTAYTIFSMGTGVHWRKLGLDIAGQIGRESGSGRRLEVTRLCLSLSAGL